MSITLKKSEIAQRAAEKLRALLVRVPELEVRTVAYEIATPTRPVDMIINLTLSGQDHSLIGEVKNTGQPLYVRAALLQLLSYRQANCTPLLIAPYLSEATRKLCSHHGVAYLDLEGNCELVFGGVFIEHSVGTKPAAEVRLLKSPFKPRSARVLRALLEQPFLPRRIKELADAAHVSVGQVFNVRKLLVEREWGAVTTDGLVLTDPDAIIDHWSEVYEPPARKRAIFVTLLKGDALDEAKRKVLHTDNDTHKVLLGSFSAAQYLMPYLGTVEGHFFYADEAGFDALRERLELAAVGRGETVTIMTLQENLLWLLGDPAQPAPHIFCTGPIQTYLDLTREGEQGREIANHLRREKLAWLQSQPPADALNPSAPKTSDTCPKR